MAACLSFLEIRECPPLKTLCAAAALACALLPASALAAGKVQFLSTDELTSPGVNGVEIMNGAYEAFEQAAGGAASRKQLARVRASHAKAMRGALGQRQVVAATGQIHAQVLPEVDELQRGADGVALAQGLLLRHAIQVQQQAAHGVGRAAAVVQQGGHIGVGGAVARHRHVLYEGAEQIVQRLRGQAEGAHLRCQRNKHLRPAGRRRLALRYGQQVSAVAGQIAQPGGGGRIAFIGQVVRRAGELVNSGNGRAQARRAQPGSDGKVFVMLGGGAAPGAGHEPGAVIRRCGARGDRGLHHGAGR